MSIFETPNHTSVSTALDQVSAYASQLDVPPDALIVSVHRARMHEKARQMNQLRLRMITQKQKAFSLAFELMSIEQEILKAPSYREILDLELLNLKEER